MWLRCRAGLSPSQYRLAHLVNCEPITFLSMTRTRPTNGEGPSLRALLRAITRKATAMTQQLRWEDGRAIRAEGVFHLSFTIQQGMPICMRVSNPHQLLPITRWVDMEPWVERLVQPRSSAQQMQVLRAGSQERWLFQVVSELVPNSKTPPSWTLSTKAYNHNMMIKTSALSMTQERCLRGNIQLWWTIQEARRQKTSRWKAHDADKAIKWTRTSRIMVIWYRQNPKMRWRRISNSGSLRSCLTNRRIKW